MSLYAGIDVSSKDFKGRILDQSGNVIAKRFRATNDHPGMESLARHLHQTCTERQDNHLVVGMEATSVYSWHLQMSLAEEPSLIPMHPQIYSFNPKVVRNFKKAYVDLPISKSFVPTLPEKSDILIGSFNTSNNSRNQFALFIIENGRRTGYIQFLTQAWIFFYIYLNNINLDNMQRFSQHWLRFNTILARR